MAAILFVCLGNICRSPTAEAVFRAHAHEAGLTALAIDSAGTGNWHIGEPPDARAISAGKSRGYDLSVLRARQVCAEDFSRFTHILAMDRQNLRDLTHLAPSGHQTHLGLFLDFAGQINADVPHPYFGGEAGFTHVLDMIEAASAGLIAALKNPQAASS